MRYTPLFISFIVSGLSIRSFGQSSRAYDPYYTPPSVPTCKLYVRNLDLSDTITVRLAQHTFRKIPPRQLSQLGEPEQIPQLGGFTISKQVDSADLLDSTSKYITGRKKLKLGDIRKLADEPVPEGSQYYRGSGIYIAEVAHTTKGDAVSVCPDSLESETDTLVLSRKDFWSLIVRPYNFQRDGQLPGRDGLPMPMPPTRIQPKGGPPINIRRN